MALLDYWDEPDSAIARMADASYATARRARIELERQGVIPHREPTPQGGDWRPGPTHHAQARTPQALPARQRARIELLLDPCATDQRLAERASCARTTVREIRRELEASGEIEVITAWERDRRSQRGEQQERHDWAELAPQPASMQTGLCVTGGHDPELWHPGRYDNASRVQALAICQRCPALADCRDWALMLPASDKYAVYGGMTANQRARHQRAQRQPAP